MALSANLQLRQSQSLVMTPQLMQSIRLLQLTHLELNNFIHQEVEKNPLLEVESGEAEAAQAVETETIENWESADGTGTETLNEQLDASYENIYPDDNGPDRVDAPELMDQWKSMSGVSSVGPAEAIDFDEFTPSQITLKDHIAEQVSLLAMDQVDRLIAAELTDHLDESGYMLGQTADIAERLNTRESRVRDVLAKLQSLEPAGVFATSLADCLAIQLRQKDRFDPAMESLVENLELLARRDFATLRRICGVDEEDLLEMLSEIRHLDPKPGHVFQWGPSEQVIPDIIVQPATSGGWSVELNPETLPRVIVNHSYYAEVSKSSPATGEDQTFLSECLQNANWLARSLDQRATTIMKVAMEIVRQQDAFLLKGVDHLKPLNLKMVAEAIKMHESTVSRVTSNKYMLTPRGVFELKYFFTVSIASTEGGDSFSAESVRHRIKQLIDDESAAKVLSDDDIVVALKENGIDLARRTVAKYREALNIPSSVQRRREKRALAKIGAS